LEEEEDAPRCRGTTATGPLFKPYLRGRGGERPEGREGALERGTAFDSTGVVEVVEHAETRPNDTGNPGSEFSPSSS
jgi:hypothetical protein